MKFAIILLVVIVLVCTVGSVVPQGKDASWYTANYSRQAAGAVVVYCFDLVFMYEFAAMQYSAFPEAFQKNEIRLSLGKAPKYMERAAGYSDRERSEGALSKTGFS